MKKIEVVAFALFALLMIEDADADADAESDLALAQRFSPILVLTEDTGNRWGDIRVLKPEPVEIVGANSASNLHFYTFNLGGKVRDIRSFDGWDPLLQRPSVNFSENRFAFLTRKFVYSGVPLGFKKRDRSLFTVQPRFDYPGNDPTSWNNTYFGKGPHAGENENFPNTSYVHIYKTSHEAYSDSITAIQYFYFYPYNHWWNRHEGDWPRVNVVVSSSDPDTAEVIGVEYLFHKAHLSYYNKFIHTLELKDGTETLRMEMPDLTSNFVFDPQKEVKLSQGTHPVVYVGAGSHGLYPFGGKILLHDTGDSDLGGIDQNPVYDI